MPASNQITEYIRARTVLDPTTGCHNWTKGLNRQGYAQSIKLYNLGYSSKIARVIMQMRHGDLEDQIVRHTCACVNPEHLILGTQQDNMDDKVSRNRQSKGESHGRAKISNGCRDN